MRTDVIGAVAALVERESGIVLGPAQLGSLEAAIARISPGMTAARLLAPQLPAETLERLIDEITVRETFFFRHRTELDAINWPAALQRARARGENVVRVWIAGCASGEEAYTIAILACEAFGTATPPVSILATDIAASALDQTRGGHYGARAVRTLEDDVRRRYFSAQNGTLRVNQRLQGLVDVRRHNLCGEQCPPPGCAPFDLILCRNVLIYFNPETVDRVVASLQGALWPGGRLVLGAADRLSGSHRPLPVARSRAVSDRSRRRPPRPGSPRQRPAQTARVAARPAHAEPTAGPSPAVTATNGQAGRERLSRALQAADRGDLDTALQIAGDVLAEDPLDAEAHFIKGVAELATEAPQAAVDSLRRALYADPSSSLAAFHLARAHDALGEWAPARRAYEQVLRTLEHDHEERSVAQQRDVGEITAACRARLGALAGTR
jgi:chemotaxis protein methyltransferase CheR